MKHSKIIILLIAIFLATPAYAATYTYDKLNRLTSVTYKNGQKINYTYDAAGNLLKVEISTAIPDDSQYGLWPDAQTQAVPNTKIWNIKFNKEVNSATIKLQYFYL